MKVCFLAGTLERGGAEKQLLYMLKTLKAGGITCRVLCLTKGESYEREIESLGIAVEWVGETQNRGSRLLKIIKSLRKESADILQSSHFYTNLYVGVAGRILGIPSIGAIRNNLTSEINAHKSLGKWQIVTPQHLIANSALACSRAIEQGIASKKIDFVRNAVEVKSGFEENLSAEDLPLKILFVGRLDKQKRPELFIKLAAALVRNLPELPIQFQIVGDGPLRRQLEKLAEDYNLTSDRLSFLGIRTDMDKIYRQAHGLVMTSEFEGTPNVLLEAMAYKLPIVAMKVDGVTEVVNESRAILVESNDEKGLIKAATEMILNSNLRKDLADAGFDYVKNNHSLESLQKQLINIYSKLKVK